MDILKTVKMYVGGAFIRSESGRTFAFKTPAGKEYARINQASRKDFRNAVEKAKGGAKSWSTKTAYLRSQILYRMAEMAQGKKVELIKVISESTGMDVGSATSDVEAAIDTFVYYAGFCDKYQQVIGSVNPVSAPYHNFTTPEPMGVVTLFGATSFSLQKLVDNICAIIVSGNSVIALVSSECPAIVTSLGEVFQTSDLPAGVVNLLSGDLEELASHVATHMEVKAISFQNEDKKMYHDIRSSSIDNMKRITGFKEKTESLELILDFVEQKTVWHPIELSDSAGGAY
jgi:acyl-CoA reductase-like NAD-dependent aldehyde dehydrogenase